MQQNQQQQQQHRTVSFAGGGGGVPEEPPPTLYREMGAVRNNSGTMMISSSSTASPATLAAGNNVEKDLLDNGSNSSESGAGGGGGGIVVHHVKHDQEKITEISTQPVMGRYAKMNVLLGKGAYKVVYKGLDLEEGYEVAWNTCQTTKAEFMELSQEIEILKRVRHPNIIQFHDYWYNNTEFVFITELMTSGTLREYIKKLQIPNIRIVKRWARQILKGLSYLHSHDPPIIHRDIKCDNIFINGAHGEVKIGDMGSAKMKMGKKYTVIGTPEFMAPEMYEEKGYSEKVDIYAFGMSLLEMVTGEYPYNECKNAAQIYKKVTLGIKPECLGRVGDPDVLDLINSCIGNEHDRFTAQEIIEHPFLAVDPEVVLLSASEDKNHLNMQVVFRGMDKLSVKFDFNVDTDTAEEVVNEMIQEAVLPAVFKQLITGEINQILREINDKGPASWAQRTASLSRKLSGGGIQLSNTPQQYLLQQQQQQQQPPPPPPLPSSFSPNIAPIASQQQMGRFDSPLPLDQLPPAALTREGSNAQQQQQQPLGAFSRKDSAPLDGSRDEFENLPMKEYSDNTLIDELVRDTALATNRGLEKAGEWCMRLQSQDIMNVGDLRDLHDEDWASLGLTVFASRALKNALYGRRPPRSSIASATGGAGAVSAAAAAASATGTVASSTTPGAADQSIAPMSPPSRAQ